MHAGAARFGFRLVHYAVRGNEVQLLVEAPDRRALGRGMKGLGVRIARTLNRVMKRRGAVISDRYRAQILRTPAAVRRARNQLSAHARPSAAGSSGRSASPTPVVAPRTWLLAHRLQL
jgi:putative transposase